MWLKALKDAKQQYNIPLPLNPASHVYHASIWKDNASINIFSLTQKVLHDAHNSSVVYVLYARWVSMCSGTAFGGSLVHTSYLHWKQARDINSTKKGSH